ncbi:MAG: hypothetical protein K0Q99_2195 [Clostridia bacterium]|nr:hypothetical protein [Clostridia bacterium]
METKNDHASNSAWNEDTYDAWVERFGIPQEAAAKLMNNPESKLNPILQHFGNVADKKIMNLMGSNGVKAVALALMGAEAAVIDISQGNAKYARELALEAGVDIKFIVSAVKLLKQGGRFVLRDFHPISTKLISSRGSTAKVRKHKVDGDYFDVGLEEKEVSFAKYLPEGVVKETRIVYWRRWTLGEVVTAVAQSGLTIKLLQEEPNLSSEIFDKGIPKTYTIVADKM